MIDEVERLTDVRPGLDDFLSAEATDALAARYVSAAVGKNVQRRTWSPGSIDEIDPVLASVANNLPARAYWLHRLSAKAGAVRVRPAPVIRNIAFSEGDHDLVLVTHAAEDGFRLAWDHLPDRDEFELVLWGSFRL